MNQSTVLWVMRQPPVSEEEWTSFLSTRDDFLVTDQLLGGDPSDGIVRLSSSGVYWWTGHSSVDDIPVVYTDLAIQIPTTDNESRALAEVMAERFDGFVHED